MKPIVLLAFALIWSPISQSQTLDAKAELLPNLPTLQEYFQSAPVHVTGRIRFERAHRLFHDEFAGRNVLEGSLQPHEDLDVWISRTELRINTQKGLRVTIAGVPIHVTNLKYNNVTEVVEVKSSFLGLDAGDFYIERRMAEEIKTKFKPKLKKAFARLVLIRKQKNLNQAAEMLNAVIDVFKSVPKPGKKPGPPLPTFSGTVTLVTSVPAAQSVRVGPAVADLKEGDALHSTVMLRVPSRGKPQFRGVIFTSNMGLILRQPKTPTTSLKTVVLSGFWATEDHGFQIEASNGADDILSGATLMIGLIRMADRGSPGDISPSTLVQDLINAKVQNGLREYVISHRADLLQAGATPKLLEALEKSN